VGPPWHPLPHHPDRPQLPKIQQSREPEPSIIKEKTIADFTRVVEQTGFWNASPWLNKARSPED